MANEPVASGTLEKTPFPHVLVYLEQRAMSGTLAIWPDGGGDAGQGQDRILLLKGRPMAGVLLQPAETLRAGMLTLFERKQAPYAFYEGNLLGNAEKRLSERIEPLGLIAESLRGPHVRDDVVNDVLSRLGDAYLELADGFDPAALALTVDETPMLELLRAGPAAVDALLGSTTLPTERAQRLLYLLVIAKAAAPADKPSAKPAPTASAPAAPPPPPPLGAAAPPTPDPPPATHAAVIPDDPPATHAAVIPDDPPATHGAVIPDDPPATHAAVIPDDAPAGGADDDGRPGLQSIPPAPDGLDEELRKRWQTIVTKGKLIENHNYFEMLEVPKDAKSSDAKAAFFKLAKIWHPDRLPAELQSLKPWVQTIFAYMSEANACLSDEDERFKYLQTVREGGGTPATEKLMERILDSAMQYERVLVFGRKHEYDKALEVLTQILQVTKDEPDYHAMYGWLLMQKFPNKPGVRAPFDEILACFDTAIGLHDDHERGHLYKGQLLRRMGRARDALAEFKRVVKINPNNVEAAREVRIANMRNSQAPGAAKKGGFLGKLFGKK